MKKFLTATQIARLEDVTKNTAARWIRTGMFEGARRVGREYRVPIESYHKWHESTKVTNERSNVRSSERTDL